MNKILFLLFFCQSTTAFSQENSEAYYYTVLKGEVSTNIPDDNSIQILGFKQRDLKDTLFNRYSNYKGEFEIECNLPVNRDFYILFKREGFNQVIKHEVASTKDTFGFEIELQKTVNSSLVYGTKKDANISPSNLDLRIYPSADFFISEEECANNPLCANAKASDYYFYSKEFHSTVNDTLLLPDKGIVVASGAWYEVQYTSNLNEKSKFGFLFYNAETDYFDSQKYYKAKVNFDNDCYASIIKNDEEQSNIKNKRKVKLAPNKNYVVNNVWKSEKQILCLALASAKHAGDLLVSADNCSFVTVLGEPVRF